MVRKHTPSPNTCLGEIHWYCDAFFGTLLPICQGLLGLLEGEDRTEFLDVGKLSLSDLHDYFGEVELEDGRLGLELFIESCGSTALALIETPLPYGICFTDQMLLNLIEDFIDHVRGLPLGDQSKREGALWTDEDIERGYCEAANRIFVDAMSQFDAAYLEALQKLDEVERRDPRDDIPF